MSTRNVLAGWYRNRFVWVAVILLAVSAGTVVLVNTAGSDAKPADLRGQIMTRLRTTLESADPGQHQHAGHNVQQATAEKDGKKPAIICGVRVYGFEPGEVSTLAEVKTVYGFHLCGVAEQKRPWDWAVKLAGPVIVDMNTEPPGIQVVEATENVRFVDRLREMFPDKYEELALKESLDEDEMASLRRRYDEAAGL
ncbi:hypothetical protein O7626_07705 [Micromonospora sp. WMMD1102]|uniref:hypothetical protein n=1 Tax=Micromonospora sp. WMMD1102 TaxID=3016105 RepID=UPI002414D52B|nr:hypothetical protein [Micromonospora sp. WMMD1102]MDG4785812.1 hypothetical protein [Micromonospora sp. WMMD1102]